MNVKKFLLDRLDKVTKKIDTVEKSLEEKQKIKEKTKK
jgi:hypothetical protein